MNTDLPKTFILLLLKLIIAKLDKPSNEHGSITSI